MSDIVFIISAIGILQSAIFGFLIILKKNKKLSDWILLFWFTVFSSHLALILTIDNSPYQLSLVLAKTFVLLQGPLLLLYTQAVFTQKISKKSLLHLLPFLVFSVGSFLVSSNISAIWEILLLISKIISLVVYPLFVRIWLTGRLKFLKTTRADNFILESIWVNTIAILLLGNAAVGILHVLANVLLEFQFSNILDILFYVMMIAIIGFYGLRFRVVYDSELPDSPQTFNKQRYKNSPLKRENIIEQRERIDQFFANTDEYLNFEFSLTQLSERVRIPKHHLSEIINLDMGTTFYDIVNAKRIQYAVLRMSDGSDKYITLEGLGYECGFNTKSAFYHHFKNLTGKTPGQFKKEIRTD
jgi:AraC-like DNA-binding protein